MHSDEPTGDIIFKNLHYYFSKKNDNEYELDEKFGEGKLLIYNIEKGISAQLLNVFFMEHSSIWNSIQLPGESNSFQRTEEEFTLVFISKGELLQLCNHEFSLQKNASWNLFLSRSPGLWIRISPGTRYQFLKIDLTNDWIYKNISKADRILMNKSQGCFKNEIVLLDNINEQESEIIKSIHEISWKNNLGPIYIKSLVLKLVSDFFSRISC